MLSTLILVIITCLFLPANAADDQQLAITELLNNNSISNKLIEDNLCSTYTPTQFPLHSITESNNQQRTIANEYLEKHHYYRSSNELQKLHDWLPRKIHHSTLASTVAILGGSNPYDAVSYGLGVFCISTIAQIFQYSTDPYAPWAYDMYLSYLNMQHNIYFNPSQEQINSLMSYFSSINIDSQDLLGKTSLDGTSYIVESLLKNGDVEAIKKIPKYLFIKTQKQNQYKMLLAAHIESAENKYNNNIDCHSFRLSSIQPMKEKSFPMGGTGVSMNIYVPKTNTPSIAPWQPITSNTEIQQNEYNYIIKCRNLIPEVLRQDKFGGYSIKKAKSNTLE